MVMAASIQQQLFPPSSPYHAMSPAAQAAVIKFVLDLGRSGAGSGSTLELGKPLVRPVFRRPAPSAFAVALFAAAIAAGLVAAVGLLYGLRRATVSLTVHSR